MIRNVPSKNNEFQLLKPSDVADILKISKSQAYRLISVGTIQAIRIGRSVRVSNKDLQEFVNGCRS